MILDAATPSPPSDFKEKKSVVRKLFEEDEEEINPTPNKKLQLDSGIPVTPPSREKPEVSATTSLDNILKILSENEVLKKENNKKEIEVASLNTKVSLLASIIKLMLDIYFIEEEYGVNKKTNKKRKRYHHHHHPKRQLQNSSKTKDVSLQQQRYYKTSRKRPIR